jgi:hypothetical protein
MVLEQIIILMGDPSLDLVFAPLLVVKFKILDPSWAIFDVHAHLIYVLA